MRHYPRHVEEIQRIVRRAARSDAQVRAVGSGHSWSPVACTSGEMVFLDKLAGVVGVDAERRTVTVQAGLPVRRLNRFLADSGLALPTLGSIDVQTVAGAISTGTHGSGLAHSILSERVSHLELVTGDGTVEQIGEDKNMDLLEAARLSLGGLGIISEVTLRCVPAFRLHDRWSYFPMDRVLADLDVLLKADNLRMFWRPGNPVALVQTSFVTEERRDRLRSVVDTAAWLRMMARAHMKMIRTPQPGKVRASATLLLERVAQSHEVLCYPHVLSLIERVLPVERVLNSEYAVPASDASRVICAFDELARSDASAARYPIEIRFAAADSIWLSPCYQRPACLIDYYESNSPEGLARIRRLEELLRSFGGRPHWGKLHHCTSAYLEQSYPRWSDFRRALRKLDPKLRFSNDHLRALFGTNSTESARSEASAP